MSTENKEHKIPAWLQRIQDNSSELELLISGGAIYALIQLSNLINTFQMQLILMHGSEANIKILLLGLSMLTLGFVLHLITRAYWLSLVCLNYVFPEGVKFENLKLQKPFKVNTSGRNDLYTMILKADKVCGLLMFISIASTVLFTGLMIPWYASIILDVSTEGEMFSIIKDLLAWSLIIYIFDLLFSGILRKVKYISAAVYPIFKLYDFIVFQVFG